MSRVVLVLAVSVLVGCAGASSEVTAPAARMPVSFSRGVRDAEGVVLPQERQEVVGHFEERSTAWGIGWSYLSLTPKTDLSGALNEQVAAAKGDAVVRFGVRAKPCAMNFVPVLGWLPIWPGCSKLVATGDIIRVKALPPPPPPRVAPSMPEPLPPPARAVAASERRR